MFHNLTLKDLPGTVDRQYPGILFLLGLVSDYPRKQNSKYRILSAQLVKGQIRQLQLRTQKSPIALSLSFLPSLEGRAFAAE